MSINGFIKRIYFFNRNPIIHKVYKEIRHINRTCGNEYASDMLKKIKAYAIEHTKFYSDYCVDDKFPVMTKADLIAHYNDILSDESFDGPIHISSTSGSTGIRFSVKQDHLKRMRTIADLKVYGEYADYRSHERMLQLRAYNRQPLDRSIDKRENIYRYDISDLHSTGIQRLIEFILKFKPRIIFGYASTMGAICDHVLRSGRNYSFCCRSVLVGAEMLTDDIADKIKRVFKCPVYDRYSNMEMGIYAQREYGKTNFIVNKASYYFEVLKMDRDEPAKENEVGRLVFTDLFNHAFPMIRYDTGDLGAFCYNGREKEITAVYGRRMDSIFSPEDTLVDPHSISCAFRPIDNIRQWQFIQRDKKEYQCRIIKNGDIDEVKLIDNLICVLGREADIGLEYVENIPMMSSYKHRCIMNEMKRDRHGA